jgi:glucose-6-phosphate 1-dehydrogenase
MSAREAALEENPLREGLVAPRVADRCTIVIFGATGDLSHRKLMPALFSLFCDGLLPPAFAILGASRREQSDDQFRADMRKSVKEHSRRAELVDQAWDDFAQGLFYQFVDDRAEDGYAALGHRMQEVARARGTGANTVFYLAVPPSAYENILARLGRAALVHPSGTSGPWTRIIVEKPFGHDLASAEDLNKKISGVFREDQIYRIDHYLGKETVQNILVLRFANGVFEPVWNRRYVDHVQITVAESIGVEGRGTYFEEAGILRDIVQNHMLQLLALTAMEPPVAFEADAVRNEKVKVLSALRTMTPAQMAHDVVRGQYGAGSVGGKKVPAYREEPDVSRTSVTETYVALKVYVDSWRWAGVPFFLRAGKRLPKRVTEVAIQFRSVPLQIFARAGADTPEPSVLALRIQPDEGITLKFGAKVPGPTIRIQSVNMDFRYGASFGEEPPEAYERLLLDVLLGDSTLFTRRDEVEAQWDFITCILRSWAERPVASLPLYDAGTWGPEEADEMIAESGRAWRRL